MSVLLWSSIYGNLNLTLSVTTRLKNTIGRYKYLILTTLSVTTVLTKEDLGNSLLSEVWRKDQRPQTIVRNRKEPDMCIVRNRDGNRGDQKKQTQKRIL